MSHPWRKSSRAALRLGRKRPWQNLLRAGSKQNHPGGFLRLTIIVGFIVGFIRLDLIVYIEYIEYTAKKLVKTRKTPKKLHSRGKILRP